MRYKVINFFIYAKIGKMIDNDRYIFWRLMQQLEHFFNNSLPDYHEYGDWNISLIDMLSKDERNSELRKQLSSLFMEMTNDELNGEYEYPQLPFEFYRTILYMMRVIVDRFFDERRDHIHAIEKVIWKMERHNIGPQKFTFKGADYYEKSKEISEYFGEFAKWMDENGGMISTNAHLFEELDDMEATVEMQKEEIESLKKEINQLKGGKQTTSATK